MGKSDPSLSRPEERRLLEAAAEAIASDFPNPNRMDCPGADAITDVVRRRLSLPEASGVIDHIATCAPCFLEYGTCRRRLAMFRATVILLVGIPIIAGLAWNFSRVRPGGEVKTIRPGSAAPLSASLDFHEWTVERSERSPTQRVKPSLLRDVRDVTIDLPLGMEDGAYSIEIRTASGQAAVRTNGLAAWTGIAERLKATFDLGKLQPGQYVLAIRKESSSWRLFPLILE